MRNKSARKIGADRDRFGEGNLAQAFSICRRQNIAELETAQGRHLF